MGPDRPAALRSGTADERRLLSAARLHEPRRLRRRLQNMRLANGTLWPMPITLDVTEDFAKKLTAGQQQDRAARSRRRDASRAQR